MVVSEMRNHNQEKNQARKDEKRPEKVSKVRKLTPCRWTTFS